MRTLSNLPLGAGATPSPKPVAASSAANPNNFAPSGITGTGPANPPAVPMPPAPQLDVHRDTGDPVK
jgi:hypothetical protein